MNRNCPIQSQITLAEDTIKGLMDRIHSLENRLRSPELPASKKTEIETELKEIKKLLTTNKELLGTLHKENTKTFMVAGALLFLFFLLYGVYVMIYGNF